MEETKCKQCGRGVCVGCSLEVSKEELARQALKRKLKRQVRGPKEAKRQAKVAEKAKSFWDV